MPIAINGTGSITGISVGGLPDATITTAELVDANVTPAKLSQPLTVGTLQTATGANVDFTGIPSWVKRITILFFGVSTNGTNNWLIQVGSGSFSTSGYLGSGPNITAAGANNGNYTAGFGLSVSSATAIAHGTVVLTASGLTWVANGQLGRSDTAVSHFTAGSSPTLSAALDRVRITTVGGTDNFDAGSINILYEG